MDVLECHANFNPAIKIKDIDREKAKPPGVTPVSGASGGGTDSGTGPGAEGDESPLDMSALFAESEEKPKPGM